MTRDIGKFIANGPHFKDKYLEEDGPALAGWFEFGIHSDGNVDIATLNEGDVFINVPKELAIKLLKFREKFTTSCIEAIRNACPPVHSVPAP